MNTKRHDLFIEGQRDGETVHKEDSAPSKAATAPSSQPSLMLSVEHNEKIKARNSTTASAATPTLPTPLPSGTLAFSSSSVKMLARQESPMNPYNKFDYPKIPDELVGIEKLQGNTQNNLHSLQCDTSLKTPIESCSYCSVDTPNVDEAVRSTVIGSIGCCKETWKRKEFYYLAKARVERAVKVKSFYLTFYFLPQRNKKYYCKFIFFFIIFFFPHFFCQLHRESKFFLSAA